MRQNLLFQRILPAYRVSLFEKLFLQLNIKCCFSVKDKVEYNEFSNRDAFEPFGVYEKDSFFFQNVLFKIITYNPPVVICEGALSYPTLWKLFFYKLFFSYKIVIWTHGIHNKDIENPFSDWKGKLKKYLFSNADALILYDNDRKELLEKYISGQKIVVANNTLDTEICFNIYEKLNKIGKENIRKELNWKQGKHIVFIGRLNNKIYLQRWLEDFKKIQSKESIYFHIIGEGIDLPKLKKSAGDNVFFYGKNEEENQIGKYLYASDVMFYPDNIGLSLVHAMCYACPVILQKKFSIGITHGPEINYAEERKNVVYFNYESENFLKEIEQILVNTDFLQMGINAQNTIKNKATSEHFINGFKEIMNYFQYK
ncbi:MAG: glycosyltransferase [Flavobacteriia bacterium]|nr:glycosyltransferase [Flavobacteriia bacterium]